MIKQKIKKLVVVASAFTLALSSMTVTAQAAVTRPIAISSVNDAAPIWDYLITMSGDLRIEDSGAALILVYCNSEYGQVNKMKAKCELQRLESGTWKTIKTWTETDKSSSILFEKETAVYKNYSYRIKLTAYAYYDSTLLEQATEIFNYGYYN